MKYLLLFALLPGSAFALRGEGEPAPMRRPCDSAQLASCQAEHHQLEEICQTKARGLAAEESALSQERALLLENRASLEQAMASIRAETGFLAAELSFLHEPHVAEAPLFPSAPPLAKIFFKNNSGQKWDERYPEQRELKLADQQSELRRQIDSIQQKYDRNTNEISALTNSRDEITKQKDTWLRDIKIHVSMWSRGCADRFCPGQ